MYATDQSMPPLRTAERVGGATARAAGAVRDAIHARGRHLVGPVRVVAMDACLFDALLIDFWHRWRRNTTGAQSIAYIRPAVSAA